MLVLGGGLAGLSAARRLARCGGRRVRVVLIDRKPHSEFNPLWPDLVSSRVRPASLRYGLEGFCRRHGVQFVQAHISAIDPAQRSVRTDAGELSGDFLLCCLGAQPNYFGREDCRARTLSLVSVDAAMEIRRRACELARAGRQRGQAYNILVVGGGYTGLETASHLFALLGGQDRRAAQAGRIIVLEKLPRVLATLDEHISDWAGRFMADLGVAVRTQLTIESFQDDQTVRLTDGSMVDSALVVWATGVVAADPLGAMDLPRTAGRRLAVDSMLRVPGREAFFAAGDAAGPILPGHDAPLRQAVQFSLAGGRQAADNILASIRGRRPRAFAPLDPGYVLPLARGVAVGRVQGRTVRGALPSCLHYAMSVYRSWSWRNRLDLLRDLLGRGDDGQSTAPK